jgi:hypothetical protein
MHKSGPPMPEQHHATTDPSPRFCSFCNKSEAETGDLVDGPWIEGTSPVFICASCAHLCSLIFKHRFQEIAWSALRPHERAVAEADFWRRFDEALQDLNLDDLESRVMKLRCGMADFDPQTYEEIADTLEIAPEKVREIELAVIRKAQSRS